MVQNRLKVVKNTKIIVFTVGQTGLKVAKLLISVFLVVLRVLTRGLVVTLTESRGLGMGKHGKTVKTSV